MNKQYSLDNMAIIEVAGGNEGICKTGVPFPDGKVTSLTQIKLTQNNKDIESHAHTLCYWRDGSIKWISISFFHTQSALNQYELHISDAPNHPQQTESSTSPPQLFENRNELTITANDHTFTLDLKTLLFKARTESQPLLKIISIAGAVLNHNAHQHLTPQLHSWHSRSFRSLSRESNSTIELTLEGCFEGKTDKQSLRFTTIVEFHHLSPSIKIQSTLHNPNPATHPQGLWDLGDDGSEIFESFLFNLELPENDDILYQTSPDATWQTAKPCTKIVQHASGGKQWQSPAHVDKNNRVTLKKNGFEVSCNDSVIDTGKRSTPVLHSSNGVGITIEKFWQNFPSSVVINKNNIKIELFPAMTGAPHELQGGEQKTYTFWLNFNSQPNDLHWIHSPPVARPNTHWLIRCAVLPHASISTETDGIAELINVGLTHKNNFFAKRETIDEYGWRNFGDLYADHETWGYQGDGLLVSHYNNQYDPIYGFLRQFLITGDNHWFELADDLAKHVKDIDVYHTKNDRPEYNGGLFWHTDHYLKAATATHRSFSRLQGKNTNEERRGGGGPGGQHCYTSGLVYHYLLTGAESSKQTVLSLTKWITRVYEGSNTCLELMLSFKNRHLPGKKNPLNGQYPFDRGTGYYITALLDSYQLTLENDYLFHAEHIIQNTLHPADNIAKRNLSNIEECWFYTVLLQSVCYYLELKETNKSYDNAFYYARDALLHYANWMLSNESPYLDKPEKLEFPNETWTAQDLRKAHVLSAAAYYSTTNKEEYLDKAIFFKNHVIKRLSASEENSYSRILVLLMQNHGPLEYYSSKQHNITLSKPRETWPKAKYQKTHGGMSRLTKELGKRLIKLSIANEIDWLKTRIK